ncbi:hypothetical protein [Bdellovibrio sp. HCB337]|uniref:hypothetical protein n=1 Tax=Bdellovibrio sp. HCB337 TaxID=3394358 RepID=UPI0039A73433
MMSWLIAVVAMIGGAYVFRYGISLVLSPLQHQFLKLPEPTSILKMVTVTKLCDVSQGSFLQNQYSAMALINSRSFSRRYSILLLCLSAAGLWTTMLAMLLTWQMDGTIFGILTGVLAIASYWWRMGRAWAAVTLGLYVLLMGGFSVLRYQDSLLSFLGESEFHFLLADGRFAAQLVWLAAAFVLTLVIRVESWTVFLALALLGAGSLSLNGAIAMVIGEMLAHVAVLMWKSRKLNQDTQKTAKLYALSSMIGLVIGFVLAGGVREVFSWGFTFDTNPLTEKSLQFFTMYFVVVAAQCAASMTWGHFAAQKKIDEVQKGDYFSIKWISRGLVSNSIGTYVLNKLHERLDLLVAQKRELDAKERARIPQAFLQEHDREVTTLSMWLPLAKDALKPRKLL